MTEWFSPRRAPYGSLTYYGYHPTEVPGYWQRRLDRAIAERTLRARARRLRFRLAEARREYARRASIAIDVMRGRHSCGDDW